MDPSNRPNYRHQLKAGPLFFLLFFFFFFALPLLRLLIPLFSPLHLSPLPPLSLSINFNARQLAHSPLVFASRVNTCDTASALSIWVIDTTATKQWLREKERERERERERWSPWMLRMMCQDQINCQPQQKNHSSSPVFVVKQVLVSFFVVCVSSFLLLSCSILSLSLFFSFRFQQASPVLTPDSFN